MAFKLLIECSKDIDKLNIDFSDGTSMVQYDESKTPKKESKEKSKNPTKSQHQSSESLLSTKKKPQTLDTTTDDSFEETHEVVDKPVIEQRERPVKISDDLKNFDI